MRVVVDASVAVKWLVAEDSEQVDAARRLLLEDHDLLAPELLLAEAANAIWKKLRRGQVTREQGDLAAEALPRFFNHTEKMERLIRPAWRIAAERNHPVYDCVYMALAEKARASLATFDERLASLARETGMDLEPNTSRAR
ncbi:MAG: type II toxin-antitoxin system VapC family toxin [Polyangia bacterium]